MLVVLQSNDETRMQSEYASMMDDVSNPVDREVHELRRGLQPELHEMKHRRRSCYVRDTKPRDHEP